MSLKNRLELMFNFLLECFDEVNIIDSLATQEIRGEEKTDIELGKSPHYWREIKNSKSSSYYYDLRKSYNNLLRKYNLDTIKLELRDLLVAKFQSLIGGSRDVE